MSRAVLTVSHDPATVESQLARRELRCPGCSGSLKPWGSGRGRTIRCRVPAANRRLVPRRARCRDCGATHILLPVLFTARRADDASVIAHAVERSVVHGAGHRKIAAELDRPATTVRGWIRDFRANAQAILAEFTARVHRATAEALGIWPAPAASTVADALGMLIAHARVLAPHGTKSGTVVNVAWQHAALAGHGPWFFSTRRWPMGVQHQFALPPGQ